MSSERGNRVGYPLPSYLCSGSTRGHCSYVCYASISCQTKSRLSLYVHSLILFVIFILIPCFCLLFMLPLCHEYVISGKLYYDLLINSTNYYIRNRADYFFFIDLLKLIKNIATVIIMNGINGS